MTFREKLMKLLEEHGMFPQDSKSIIEVYENGETGKIMKSRLDDDMQGYPDTVLTVTWLGVKTVGRQWLADNHPHHWARPMFDEAA